jgi:hypothetical protein
MIRSHLRPVRHPTHVPAYVSWSVTKRTGWLRQKGSWVAASQYAWGLSPEREGSGDTGWAVTGVFRAGCTAHAWHWCSWCECYARVDVRLLF